MGLFSFLKNAGAKLLSKKAEDKQAELNAEKAANMHALVSELGLNIRGFKAEVDGDCVIVTGQADKQADREKAILAVGNVAGISCVDDRMTVTNPEPEAKFYEVQSGDSLSKIAKAHYGDPMKYNAIFEANKPMLKHPDKIYPGQMLRIPAL